MADFSSSSFYCSGGFLHLFRSGEECLFFLPSCMNSNLSYPFRHIRDYEWPSERQCKASPIYREPTVKGDNGGTHLWSQNFTWGIKFWWTSNFEGVNYLAYCIKYLMLGVNIWRLQSKNLTSSTFQYVWLYQDLTNVKIWRQKSDFDFINVPHHYYHSNNCNHV